MSTLPTIRPLDALARTINDTQVEIEFCAKMTLKWARKAGEALIEAKKQLPHGQFKAWVEASTRVSYKTAAKYMKVAREWEAKCLADETFADLSIDAFLGYSNPTNVTPKTNLPTFTEDDAEYALKIAARLDSDFEGEREVAADKLNAFAKQHGMTGEELVEKAKKLKPAQHLTEVEAGKQELRTEILSPFQSMSKQELLDVIFNLIIKMSRGN